MPTITTDVFHSVTIGSAGMYSYVSPLTVASNGEIAPFGTTGAGADGVYSDTSGVTLKNYGYIYGGLGTASIPGGIGVDLLQPAALVDNDGHIVGGTDYFAGNGGIGVFMSGGTLTNERLIAGGHAQNTGSGGVGVVLSSGATLTNSAFIHGGVSAYGPGGAGVDVGNGTALTNTFYIEGGSGGGNGVNLDGGTLTTSGEIAGGPPGGQATSGYAVDFGTLASTMTVQHGAEFLGDIGGFNVGDVIDITNMNASEVSSHFSGDTLNTGTYGDGTLNFTGNFTGDAFVFSNDGSSGTDITLVVGQAISSTLTSTVTLGSAAHKSPLTISNAGGVAPTAAGAIGVVSNISGNILTNHGAINGGAGSSSGTGGKGGVGVNFEKGTTLTNTGSITGGHGGAGSAGVGGVGGAGVNLLAGTLTNTGSITGGAGGTGSAAGGAGGAGVVLNGGTLITAGIISGGAGGLGAPNGAAGDAVKFGTAASILIVDPGAVFNDKVVANASVHDVLELAGKQSGGTPITLGTQFTNFSTLDFAAGAHWTADANTADLTSHPLTIDGFGLGDKLDIRNLAASGSTLHFDPTSRVLTVTNGGTTITLQFDSAFSGKHFVLTAQGSGTDVSLKPGAAQTLAAASHDLMNFVGHEHRALLGDGSTLGAHGAGSGFTLHTDPTLLALSGHGSLANAFNDHGIAHASVVLR
jgi:hypothetical protein